MQFSGKLIPFCKRGSHFSHIPLFESVREDACRACICVPVLAMSDPGLEGILFVLRQRLSEAQISKFSSEELLFLLASGFDDVDALSSANPEQLDKPPGGRGGLRPGRSNVLLKAFGAAGECCW